MTQRLGARRGDVPVDVDRVANDLSSAENGVVVFASSTGMQFSLERADWGNGAFTKALLEGLEGEADYTEDGAITVNELELYIAERVKVLTGGKQPPPCPSPRPSPTSRSRCRANLSYWNGSVPSRRIRQLRVICRESGGGEEGAHT